MPTVPALVLLLVLYDVFNASGTGADLETSDVSSESSTDAETGRALPRLSTWPASTAREQHPSIC